MAFLNTFLSYLLLVIVFTAVGGAGIALGITMRRRKNSQEPSLKTEQSK